MTKMFGKSWEDVEKRVTFYDIWRATRKPEPYQMPSKKSVTEVFSILWLYSCRSSHDSARVSPMLCTLGPLDSVFCMQMPYIRWKWLIAGTADAVCGTGAENLRHMHAECPCTLL